MPEKRAFAQIHTGPAGNRGAALIIVIAIMTILLAIALTFFTTANIEVNIGTNVSNTTRADLLSEAAFAIAISMLNQDFTNNPQATSLDHPWRSLPNGMAVAGKPFARYKGRALPEATLLGIRNPGLPEFNFSQIDRRVGAVYVRFADGVVEPLFQGARSKQWLYIPRYQGPSDRTGNRSVIVLYECVVLEDELGAQLDINTVNTQLAPEGLYVAYYAGPDTADCLGAVAAAYGLALDQLPTVTDEDVPFVTSAVYGQVQVDNTAANVPIFPVPFPSDDPDGLRYPDEQVGAQIDVDNDGDGQPDSIWIPIPSDLYFPQDGIDNNLSGFPDEQQDDGGNNDGNFESGDMAFGDSVTYVEAQETAPRRFNDADEAIEAAVFAYYAGDDGLDNDGDGLVDAGDPDENGAGPNRGLFLTAPLPGLSFYIDLDADGVAYDLVPDSQRYQEAINDGITDENVRLARALTPLRVALPPTVRVLYNNVYVTLGPANVDTIDNDYDLVVNDYSAYCYIGPNTLGLPFRPPFETFFDDDGYFVSTASADVFNSYQRFDADELAGLGWIVGSIPPPAYYTLWRGPGNWFQPVPVGVTINSITDPNNAPSPNYDPRFATFADLSAQIGDPALFSKSRRKAFIEISADAFDNNADGLPDITFSPRNIQLISPTGAVNQSYDLNDSGAFLSAVHVTHSGEPVCEIAGRVAIFMKPEDGKVNLNAAGGHTVNDEYPVHLGARYDADGDPIVNNSGPVAAATLGEGNSPFEYNLRMLPGVGPVTAGRLWAARVGSPAAGAVAKVDTSSTQAESLMLGSSNSGYTVSMTPLGENYALDSSFPGYGRVDDNADALLRALDGKDDDGDGLIDEGLFLPKLSVIARDTVYNNGGGYGYTYPVDPNDGPLEWNLRNEIDRYLEYFNRLGNVENIDDPREFLIAAALRQRVAERDGIDNNKDDAGEPTEAPVIVDEAGELGDRVYSDINVEEIHDRSGIDRPLIDKQRHLLTTFSTTRNSNFVTTAKGAVRAINKIDFNYATPQQIAAALLVQGDFEPATARAVDDGVPLLGKVGVDANNLPFNTNGFFRGLLRGDTTVEAPNPTTGSAGFANTPTNRGDAASGGMGFVRIGGTGAGAYWPTTTGPDHIVPADPLLQALQLAANISDSNDRDHARTVLSTEKVDVRADTYENQNVINWPEAQELNARERVNAAALVPTEEIERYIQDTLGLEAKSLQVTDDWWSSLVINSSGGARGEQRHLSYTVAGREAIRINELMVRPTRRVEAEMTSADPGFNSGTGVYTPQNIGDYFGLNTLDPLDGYFVDTEGHRNFDPAPVFDLSRDGDYDADPLPDFPVTRQVAFSAFFAAGFTPIGNPGNELYTNLDPDIQDFISNYAYLPPAVIPDLHVLEYTWFPDVNQVTGVNGVEARFHSLGENVAISNVAPSIERLRRPATGLVPPEDFEVPDVVQYIIRAPRSNPNDPFAAPNGLPAGRYYLTVNTVAPDGTVTITGGDQIDYSIKYARVTDLNIDNGVADLANDDSILGDIYQVCNDLTNTNSDLQDWLAAHFVTVPDSHIAGGRIDTTYGAGRRPGWMFIDGTPIPPVDNAYFLDGGGELLAPYDDPLTIPVENPRTHTVTIPPYNSGIALCIAFKRNVSHQSPTPDAPEPKISINFFDFQQQPDHEWVELVNTSDETVDIGNWQLQVGIPDAVDRTGEDPHKSIWTIPEGSQIAAGGTVLLGFDVFDKYRETSGVLGSGIEANGMGLAAWDSTIDPASLPGLPEPLDAQPYGFDVLGVTPPPINDISALGAGNADFVDMFSPLGRFYDVTGSVFLRGVDPRMTDTGGANFAVDYVDRDGDGVSSYVLAAEASSVFDALLASAPDREQALYSFDAVADDARVENDEVKSSPDSSGASAPWDRIIQLECNQLRKQNETGSDPISPISPDANPLRIEDMTVAGDETYNVNYIADIVLRGGVLPDYPEHDGIDNDGDGAYYTLADCTATATAFRFNYVAGTLEKDMVDNDLNGLIDERSPGTERDDDLNSCIDPPNDSIANVYEEQIPDISLSEGVDEGNLFDGVIANSGILQTRLFGPGSFEAGLLPAIFLGDRRLYPSDAEYLSLNVSGGFLNIYDPSNRLKGIGTEVGVLGIERLGGTEAFDPVLASVVQEAYFLGSDLDPPDWKAFAERRWNPGDNVIVSLYDGNGDSGSVNLVDRVTYREYDVINRTIDDVAPCPYFADLDNDNEWDANELHLNLLPEGAGAFAPLDAINLADYPGYPSMWRPNHMGLDFYRSLERKDPDYAGDLFGTTNRWEPTDGNYDDWAESMPIFGAGVLNLVPGENPVLPQVTRVFERLPDPDLGSLGPQPGWAQDYARLYRHCLWGSPLRMNLASRLLRNPADLPHLLLDVPSNSPYPASFGDDDIVVADHNARGNVRPFGQFATLFEASRPGGGDAPNRDWTFSKAAGADRYTHRDMPGNLNAPAASLDALESLSPAALPVLRAGSANENVGRRGMDEPMRSPSDLMRLAMPEFRHAMFNAAFAKAQPDITYSGDPFVYRQDALGYESAQVARRRFPVQLVSGVFGRENIDEGRDAPLTQAMDLTSFDTIVLSVGQASFTPVAPAAFEFINDPITHPFPPGENYFNLVNWTPDLGTPANSLPPAAWSPIFLYELPDDDLSGPSVVPNQDAYPFYPAYANGAVTNTLINPLPYLLSTNYLFPNGAGAPSYFSGASRGATNAANTPDYGLSPVSLDNKAPDRVRRAPLEKRAAMYVSMKHSGMENIDRADAVFTWDQEDGLENGEYVVYVGTFLPGLRDRIAQINADIATASAGVSVNGQFQPDTDATLSNTDTDERAAILEALLALEDGNTQRWNPRLQMEFITERTRAKGIAPATTPVDTPKAGLLRPDLWQPALEYTADSDGFIFYGDQAAGAWRPIVVRVTDNFLALRVRNAGDVNDVAAITQVVLTPRKRVPGKININATQLAQVHPFRTGGDDYLFSALLGLPGVYNDFQEVAPVDDDSVDTPPLVAHDDTRKSWAALDQSIASVPAFVPAAVPPTTYEPGANADSMNSYTADPLLHPRIRATQLAALIQAGRSTHADGRYYTSISQLVRDDSAFYNRRANGAVTPAPSGDTSDDDNQQPKFPLSNNLNEEARFDEATERFRRMANNISVRSDVFEIIATVQAGYGIDADGDGRFNYRSPDEFVATAESKGRVVYERRAPSDTSDQPGGN